MNGFNLSDIQDARLGGTQLSAIYLGSTQLWQAHDYSQEYLTIESLADNNTISWWLSDGNYGTNKYISYSTDKTNWTSVSSHYTSPGSTITTLNTGDKIYLKGSNNQYANSTAYCKFNTTGAYKVYGNIISLVNNGNFNNNPSISTYAFTGLFRNSSITDVSNLILSVKSLSSYCYANMFKGCSSLTTLPVLQATSLEDSCYRSMFDGCIITSIPNNYLPITTLTNNCYREMFKNCTSLTSVPSNLLPATTLKDDCYNQMFYSCSKLTTAPDLPATTLVSNCYYYMFRYCSKLNYVKAMFKTTPGSSYTSKWLQGVASNGTFVKNSSASWTGTGDSIVPSGWTVRTASE